MMTQPIAHATAVCAYDESPATATRIARNGTAYGVCDSCHRAEIASDYAKTVTDDPQLQVCLAAVHRQITAAPHPVATAHAFVRYFERALAEVRA